jgi:hypothetical protein
MKQETIIVLGASAGAGYGYFYATDTWASPAVLGLHFGVLGGFAAFALTKVMGWD